MECARVLRGGVRLGGALVALLVATAGGAPASAARRPQAAPAVGWWLSSIRAPAAWHSVTRAAEPVVVAVLDSGLDPAERALAGGVVPGHDFVQGGSDTSDDLGHGTLVAAAIAGRGGAGVCPVCLVMPLRVIDATGHAYAPQIAAAIRWAVDHGAAVLNMSFAMPTTDPGIAAALTDALQHGVVVVAGAGNGGPAAAPVYPAAYPGVVSVAAVDAADRLESWSGGGAWVSVAAPGCSDLAGVGNVSTQFCGTSNATALVSGVLGLALSAEPGTTADELLAALRATSVPVAGVAWGRVDASSLVRALRPAERGAA